MILSTSINNPTDFTPSSFSYTQNYNEQETTSNIKGLVLQIYNNFNIFESSVAIEDIKTLERLEKLTLFYNFKNPQKIKDFLFSNRNLIDILEEAPIKIFSVFGKNIKLELELYKDIEEGWQELFIIIKSNYSPKKAFELEKKLYRNWFKNILPFTKGLLNFTENPL